MSSSSSRILSRFLQSFSSLKLLSSSNKFRASSNPCKAFPTDYIKRLETADRTLKTKLQCEIKRAEEFDDLDHSTREDSDYACPFEVVDIPGDDKLIFKRDFGNEKIVIASKLEYKRVKCVLWNSAFYILLCNLWKNMDDLLLEMNNLQNIGEHYLERRGIDSSFTQFAHNYLIDRYQEDCEVFEASNSNS